MKICHWVSCQAFTVHVASEDCRIVSAAPIVRRFVGQPLDNLLNWVRKQPGSLRVVSEPAGGALDPGGPGEVYEGNRL